MKKKFLAALLTAALAASAEEVQNIDPLRGVTFKRHSLGNGTFNATRTEHYNYRSVTLPAWPGSVRGRGYLAHIMATERPHGATTMWLTWTFVSRGLFATNPNAHAAFITRSVSSGLTNVGQGMIVGGLSTITQSVGGACQPGFRSQPETWHESPGGTAGNVVLGGPYCSPRLNEYRPYNAWVHSAPDGYGYGIQDAVTGQTIQSVYVPNALSPSAEKLGSGTGFTIGIVFADTPGTSWEFEVSNLQMGWF